MDNMVSGYGYQHYKERSYVYQTAMQAYPEAFSALSREEWSCFKKTHIIIPIENTVGLQLELKHEFDPSFCDG